MRAQDEDRAQRREQLTESRAQARAGRSITLPPQAQWQRMHPVSPLLQGWKIITAVLAVITVQNLDDIIRAWRYASEHGLDLGHDLIRWAFLGVVAVVLAISGVLFLSWRMRSYAVDRDAVYLRSGILTKQLRTARLPRIQSVDILHPLLGRILGLGQLTVEVAGGGDSRVVIGYLRTRDLESLRDEILSLASGAAEAASRGEAPTGSADEGLGPALTEGDRQPGDVLTHPVTLPRGFEDASPGDPIMRLCTEEQPLYEVDTKVLLGSLVRSGQTLVVALMVLAVLCGVSAAVIADDVGVQDLTGIIPAVMGPLALAGVVWNRFAKGWGFRAAATPSGIRMRFGLTAETSATLPPGRVHSVKIEQGPFWHGKDWWRVGVTVAGRTDADASSGSGSANGTNVLLPVGERDTALRALWLVVPDLGLPDPDALLEAALCGKDDDGVGSLEVPVGEAARGFVRVSPRGRIFSPLGWRREAIMLTDTCVVLRLGRWWRRVCVIPYERIQSLSVNQGPFARRRGLAEIRLDMVSTAVPTALSNLDLMDATAIEKVIAERALRRRREERLDRWLLRATQAENLSGSSTSPVE